MDPASTSAQRPVARRTTAPLVVGRADDPAEREAEEVSAHVQQVIDRMTSGEAAPAMQPSPVSTRVRRSPLSEILREVPPDRSHPGPEVSNDRGAEAEADRVADAAVARLGRDSTSPATVGTGLSPTLRRALGDVAPDLHNLDDVRVHTGPRAMAETDAIGARAFTRGADVSVARGELANPVEGHRLLAHEAVHAARHQPSAKGGLVHAKLRGTKDALVAMAGGTTSGRVRKAVSSKTNWDKIIEGVGAYESLEAAVLKAGNPKPTEMAKLTPQLLQVLAKIESACAAWTKANPDKSGVVAASSKKLKDEGELADSDTRDKAQRRQAIAMLLPRIRLEAQDLQSGTWTKGLGLSDAQKLDKQGREGSGQMNTVNELHYATESGEFSGFFKADKGFAKEIQGHEAHVGITQHDPNYGARSVAMYRLDQLLKANVTARAEFAAHDGKLGTVLESAKGKDASKTAFASGADQKAELGKDAVLTSDPVLQRAMNKLQILDAICGQLDRHQGNWYIDTDDNGNVKGVTGIDLDMAFGAEMKGVEGKDAADAHNYLGMPDMVDEEFAMQIQKVKPSDIRAALKGLLPDNEVEATVSRFTSVQKKIEEVAKKRGLTKVWNEATAEENRLKKSTVSAGHTSYGSQVSAEASKTAVIRVGQAVKAAFEGSGPPPFKPWLLEYFRDIPDKTAGAIRSALIYLVGGSTQIKESIWRGDVPPGKAVAVAMDLINSLLDDDRLLARVEIAVQEMASDGNAYMVVEPLLRKRFDDLLAAKIKALGTKVLV